MKNIRKIIENEKSQNMNNIKKSFDNEENLTMKKAIENEEHQANHRKSTNHRT